MLMSESWRREVRASRVGVNHWVSANSLALSSGTSSFWWWSLGFASKLFSMGLNPIGSGFGSCGRF